MSKLRNRNRKVKLTAKNETSNDATEAIQPVELEVAAPIEPAPVVVEPEVSVVQVVAKPEVKYEIKPVKLDFKIDPQLARNALIEVTAESHIGPHISTQPTSERTAVLTFESKMPGYRNWQWLVMLSWLDEDHLTIDEVAMVPTEEALIAPAWIPWSQRLEAGDLGIGDELPYQASDPALAPGYVEANLEVIDDQETLRPLWWSLGLGRERVLSPTGRELAAQRWSTGEYSAGAIMAKVAQGNCQSCGYFNPLAGALGSAFGACTNALSPADGKVVAMNFGCGAHSETDVVEEPISTIDLVYDDTYDQGLSDVSVDNDDAIDNQ